MQAFSFEHITHLVHRLHTITQMLHFEQAIGVCHKYFKDQLIQTGAHGTSSPKHC
jgi:hypothetical protein